MAKHKMSVFEKHRYKIAKDTLKMPDAIANVMGGMTKAQSKDFINEMRRKNKI